MNNDYTHWEMYAIGGSADPTINSQGNRYLAPTNPFAKEVSEKENSENGYSCFRCVNIWLISVNDAGNEES